MAVSKEQVFEAANQLVADNQKPTLESVRQITGGSYTTIGPALREWKASQQSDDAPLREPIPQSITDQIEQTSAAVWSVALDLANARLKAEREALEKDRAEIEGDRQEAIELADKLSQQVEGMKADREKMQARVASLESAEARVTELKGELADARKDAIQAREEAARLAGQLDVCREQLQALAPNTRPKTRGKKASPSS